MFTRVQWIALLCGFATGAIFKLLEMVAGASWDEVATDWRNWLATLIFGTLSGGAAYVLARWTPSEPPA